jgi:hypothetical protein
MAIQLNGQEVGPIKFTDDKPGKTIHVGPVTPTNPVDGDVWIDSDALNNAGKNLVQTVNLTSGSTKTCAVSSDYKDLEIIIRNLEVSVNATMSIRLNGDSASNYVDSGGTTTTALFLLDSIKSGITTNHLRIQVADVTATTTSKVGHVQGVYTLTSTSLPRLVLNWTGYVPTAAITSVVLTLTAGTFVSGTALVYGVN